MKLSSIFHPIRALNQMLGTDETAYDCAMLVIPRVVRSIPPIRSVIDLGCGAGQWLAAFHEKIGCDIHGYDLRPYRKSKMWIKESEYTCVDLSRPGIFSSRVDLAICLEVAEHLPESIAPHLVTNLCDVAPAILFSAATPGQGGWKHINEQPLEYWSERFVAKGYQIVAKFTDMNFAECPWYRKNMRLYLKTISAGQ